MHYYLIYAVLKYLNLNLGFSRYSQAILKNAGYNLNTKKCNEIKDKLVLHELSKGRKEEDNSWCDMRSAKEEVNREIEEIHMV